LIWLNKPCLARLSYQWLAKPYWNGESPVI
jgi:hypothetical protein